MQTRSMSSWSGYSFDCEVTGNRNAIDVSRCVIPPELRVNPNIYRLFQYAISRSMKDRLCMYLDIPEGEECRR